MTVAHQTWTVQLTTVPVWLVCCSSFSLHADDIGCGDHFPSCFQMHPPALHCPVWYRWGLTAKYNPQAPLATNLWFNQRAGAREKPGVRPTPISASEMCRWQWLCLHVVPASARGSLYLPPNSRLVNSIAVLILTEQLQFPTFDDNTHTWLQAWGNLKAICRLPSCLCFEFPHPYDMDLYPSTGILSNTLSGLPFPAPSF